MIGKKKLKTVNSIHHVYILLLLQKYVVQHDLPYQSLMNVTKLPKKFLRENVTKAMTCIMIIRPILI